MRKTITLLLCCGIGGGVPEASNAHPVTPPAGQPKTIQGLCRAATVSEDPSETLVCIARAIGLPPNTDACRLVAEQVESGQLLKAQALGPDQTTYTVRVEPSAWRLESVVGTRVPSDILVESTRPSTAPVPSIHELCGRRLCERLTRDQADCMATALGMPTQAIAWHVQDLDQEYGVWVTLKPPDEQGCDAQYSIVWFFKETGEITMLFGRGTAGCDEILSRVVYDFPLRRPVS